MANQKFLNIFSIILILVAAGCAHQPKQIYDAVVDQKAKTIPGRFNTIQAALNAAPSRSKKPYRILIRAGNYHEKLTINKSNLQLIGEGYSSTRIHYGAYAGQIYSSGKTWDTPGSATLTIRATNIHIENISIENTFDFLSNDLLAINNSQRITNSQAVALFLGKGADKILVRNSRILGFHNTLFVNSGRSWFDKTFIAGNLDFIVGSGNALFTDSEIKVRKRGKLNFPYGYLLAPSTKISEQYGLTFINCRLTRESDVPDNSVPLGHPWHPTTEFKDGRYADPDAIGKAVLINNWMDNHITIDGWYSMQGIAKDGTKISFFAEDARFFEYNSHGPGAEINYKRRQLTPQEIKTFTRDKILGDWKIE